VIFSGSPLCTYRSPRSWPDRQVEVTTTANGLLINSEDGQAEALPLDERTFLADRADPDRRAAALREHPRQPERGVQGAGEADDVDQVAEPQAAGRGQQARQRRPGDQAEVHAQHRDRGAGRDQLGR